MGKMSPVRGGRLGDTYEFGMLGKGGWQISSAVWCIVNQEMEYKKLMD
jgi:hypothetical protein